jgi:hypothetical protein
MIIENSKTYNASEVENLFFRPSFCGKSAEELGVKVLYNMPSPTKIPTFQHENNIIREFVTGWQGGSSGLREDTEIELIKLKAETAYAADAYFASIYELLVTSPEVNLGDLTGTDLEKAETELFRRSIAESIYTTMWFGDQEEVLSNFTSFTGFLRKIIDIKELIDSDTSIEIHSDTPDLPVNVMLQEVWMQAREALRALASEGNLAYFVSSDIYDAYYFWLEEKGVINTTGGANNSRPTLSFHGIPLVEIPSNKYEVNRARSFCILTDRRNLILALNTTDSPEKEIKMWYNHDEMENRQRVVFLAGTAIMDKELVSAYIFDEGVNL